MGSCSFVIQQGAVSVRFVCAVGRLGNCVPGPCPSRRPLAFGRKKGFSRVHRQSTMTGAASDRSKSVSSGRPDSTGIGPKEGCRSQPCLSGASAAIWSRLVALNCLSVFFCKRARPRLHLSIRTCGRVVSAVRVKTRVLGYSILPW